MVGAEQCDDSGYPFAKNRFCWCVNVRGDTITEQFANIALGKVPVLTKIVQKFLQRLFTGF